MKLFYYGALMALAQAFVLAGAGFCQNLLVDNFTHLMTVEEDVRMYLAVDVSWDTAGNSYILFLGSCTVLVVNSEFEVVGEFGDCGLPREDSILVVYRDTGGSLEVLSGASGLGRPTQQTTPQRRLSFGGVATTLGTDVSHMV